MPRPIARQHVQLDFSQLTDEDRRTLVAGILLVAPKSELYQNSQAIQDSVAVLGNKGKALEERNESVAGLRAELRMEISEEAVARSALDGEILTLATLTEVNAKTPADLVMMAFKPRDTTRSRMPPEPPDGVDVQIPRRGRGKVTVSAHQSDRKRRSYEAEMCLYGSDTWTKLVGHGKTRTLTAPPGTRIWVRFATVRGEQQSAFCTPALVTIP